MVNYNFENNDLHMFFGQCKNKSLVVMGNESEVDAIDWNFLKPKKIVANDIYYFEGNPEEENIEEKVYEIRDKYGNEVVVLIAYNHPYYIQKLLLKHGIDNYFCSKLFMERYTFYNNTNICYFYLDE
ncbi:MAG: hypothetical protein K6F53_03470 [Lachnospiraceae bacterium]|nr:hypothetical protein [Lachnospiraceae bacterium]